MIRRILSALALVWLLGFVWFAMFLPQPLGDWRTDGIVVFTGGPHRISRALDLLAAGQAERVLISGVDPDVRPVDLAATYHRPVALFDCCVALGRLVTTDWHMRRARFELERSLPSNVVIVSDAVPSRPSFRTLWVEYHKLILRSVGAVLGI
jgi:uncharacterized SAM-binding protein YcdF (DUF218 family)